MSNLRFYEIFLPMPPSVNEMYDLTKAKKNPITKKWERNKVRSGIYEDWLDAAGREWRCQYQDGVEELFKGRLALQMACVWAINDPAGLTSDIDNRFKACQDFLQGKFFKNDSQFDRPIGERRLWGNKRPYAWVRVIEIPDKRFTDPALLFE